MSRISRNWLRRTEAVLVAIVFVVNAAGMALVPLTTPGYVRAVVRFVGSSELTGLTQSETLAAAESVRQFVVDPDAPALPTRISGRPAFDETAVSHLLDVRDVLIGARALAVCLTIVSLGWFLLRRRTAHGKAMLCRAASGAGATLLSVTLGVAVAAAFDFDAFFSVFHSLFFASGTWVFPADALLIQIFPLPFWMISASAWACLIVLEGTVLLIIGRHCRSTMRSDSV